MSWRDDLQPASFRGVPFKVSRSKNSGGRRIAEHEYPGRDVPFMEDLGRASREFTLEAYIVGEDYIGPKNAFIDALEASGPGELVHPTVGLRDVVVKQPFTWSESIEEGGMVRFSIVFIEAGIRENPQSSDDEASAIRSSADDLIEDAKAFIIEVLQMDGVPEFVRDAAAGQLTDALAVLAGMDITAGTTQDSAQYAQKIQEILDDPVAALLDISGFADDFAELMGSAGVLSGGDKQAISTYSDVYDVETLPSQGTTDTQQIADLNRETISAFSRQVALAEAAVSAQSTEYESFEDAVSTRSAIVDSIDEQLQDSPYEIFTSLQSVRADLVNVVPGQTTQLPRIETVVLPMTVPTVVMAYDLYEDIERAEEIAIRNNIRHPGFPDSGVPLEVLSDV